MKKAYAYVRISTEGQSNYSLPAQQEAIRRWADQNGYDVVRVYEDDGQSGSSFDRQSWRKLEADLRRERKEISAVVVAKYDRLIRNAAEGLAFLERVEQQWNVKVISATEMAFIPVNPESPYFFKMRADMLVNAEFELKVIKHRTKEGIYQAQKSGRFINRAPWHYENIRDDRGLSAIQMIPERADVVYQMGVDFLNGMTFSQIIDRAREKGYPKTGNSAVRRELENPLNGGMIRVRSFNSNPEQLVPGIHEGVWSEQMYWKIQSKLRDAGEMPRSVESLELPLRGVLACCGCGRELTGGRSRSKSGRYYWYYRCNDCKPTPNFNWKKIHSGVSKVLTDLSLSESMVATLVRKVRSKLAGIEQNVEMQLGILQKEKTSLSQKLEKLEEKFINDLINEETFSKWKSKWSGRIYDIEEEIQKLKQSKGAVVDENTIRKLADLGKVWAMATVTQKQQLMTMLFPGGIFPLKTGGFVTYAEPLLNTERDSLNTSIVNGLTVLGAQDNPNCARSGSSFEHFTPETILSHRLLDLLKQIRA